MALPAPALAFDDSDQIILFTDVANFISSYGVALLYSGLPANAPYALVAPAATEFVPASEPVGESEMTAPVVVASTAPATTPIQALMKVFAAEAAEPVAAPVAIQENTVSPAAAAVAAASDPSVQEQDAAPAAALAAAPAELPAARAGGSTSPPYQIGNITRPMIYFDAAGNIILEPATAAFAATYGTKLLYVGLPSTTPYPPVAASPPSTPVDGNAAANQVAEGTAANTSVGITASSTSLIGPVSYRLTADSSGGGFKVDAATGVVTVDDPGRIDFETAIDRTYGITVSASDGVSTSAQSFTVAVTNVAPTTPVDSNAAANTIAENAAAGTLVGITARATDVNGPSVRYAITADSSGGGFTIDAATGIVSVANSSKLDYETTGAGKSYSVTLLASDGTLTASQTFSIAVTDINDNSPVLAPGTARSIAENVATTIAVYTARATDADGTAPNNTLRYSLSGTDAGLFDISATTGAVTFKTSPDFDVPADADGNNIYDIVVTATDSGNPALADSQAVSIRVTDVNDTAPVFTSNAAPGAAENTQAVITLTTTDADTVGNNPPAFTISGGADSALFRIVNGNQLEFIVPRDYETQARNYVVQVSANDGVNTTAQNINVALTDVNDNAPVFISSGTATTAENVATTTAIYTARATDADGSVSNNTLRYAISGTDAALFNIDATTGAVTFKTVPDYEAPADADGDNLYDFIVRATDSGDPALISDRAVSIAVTDINDTAPVFTSTMTPGVAEGETAIVSLRTTDIDTVGNNPPVFAISGGADEGLFRIVNGNRLEFIAPRDYETQARTYTVQVSANDGVNTGTQTINIALTDVNDNAPLFRSPTAVSVVENITGPAYVAVAGDADSTAPNNTLTYAIGGTDANLFDIDADTGAVTFKTSPDFESPGNGNNANIYDITVTATDRGNPALSATQAVAITVTDVNDIAPVFASGTSASVNENVSTGTAIYTATAFDFDGTSPNNLPSYSISGTDGALFNIDAATGDVTFKASPNFERPADAGGDNIYDITVTALRQARSADFSSDGAG